VITSTAAAYDAFAHSLQRPLATVLVLGSQVNLSLSVSTIARRFRTAGIRIAGVEPPVDWPRSRAIIPPNIYFEGFQAASAERCEQWYNNAAVHISTQRPLVDVSRYVSSFEANRLAAIVIRCVTSDDVAMLEQAINAVHWLSIIIVQWCGDERVPQLLQSFGFYSTTKGMNQNECTEEHVYARAFSSPVPPFPKMPSKFFTYQNWGRFSNRLIQVKQQITAKNEKKKKKIFFFVFVFFVLETGCQFGAVCQGSIPRQIICGD
jgi:hypothetical protein